MARTIAIANQKGGVGKTTTAINLSASIAAAGHRCLLVDMDPQGNASSGMGVAIQNLDRSLYDVLAGKLKPADVVVSTSVAGLSLMPSGPDLAGLEVELVDREDRAFYLKNALQDLSGQFDFIFIDTPPSLGLLTVNVLSVAGSLIIPIQCEYYALEGLGQLLNVVTRIQQGLNPSLSIEGILLTMYDKRLSLSKQVAAEAIKYFKGKVYRTKIPRNVRLSEAPSFGKPVLAYDIESSGAQTYIQLAREVIHAEESVGAGA